MKKVKVSKKKGKSKIVKNEIVITKILRETPSNVYYDDYDEFEEKFGKCHVCEREIDEGSEYAYLYVFEGEDDLSDDVIFCSKKCWKEHVLREAERLRAEKGWKLGLGSFIVIIPKGLKIEKFIYSTNLKLKWHY